MYQKVSVDDVVSALATLNENKGANTKQVVRYLKESFTCSDNNKRDLTTQVRLALKKAVANGHLVHCAGRYKISSLLSTKNSLNNENNIEKEAGLLANAVINQEKSSVSSSRSNSSISHNIHRFQHGLSTTVINNNIKKEIRSKPSDIWTMVGNAKEYEVQPIVETESSCGEYLWASDMNENNNELCNTTVRAYNSPVGTMPQELATHHYMTTATVAPSFYVPQHLQEGYILRRNNSCLVTDYVKHHLYETSEGLKRASELLENGCEQLTPTFTLPYPATSNQHIISVPCCTYQPPVAAHNLQTSHNLVYVPSCNIVQQTSTSDSTVKQQCKCMERVTPLDEKLWKLRDKRPSFNDHSNYKTICRERNKKNHCRRCCRMKAYSTEDEVIKCYKSCLRKCKCQQTSQSINLKSNELKEIKRRKSKRVANKNRAKKVQQQKKKTQNLKKHFKGKGKKVSPVQKRKVQRNQRTVKKYLDKQNKILFKKLNEAISVKKENDAELHTSERSDNGVLLPLAERGDMIKDDSTFSKSSRKGFPFI